jgi:hypothetical protein
LDSPYFFEGTTYWSPGDEDAHFQWMQRIGCVREVKGVGRRLFLDIATDRVSEADLRELQAIYRRYGGDLSQLAGIAAASEEKNDA